MKEILEKRKQLSKDEYTSFSEKICKKLEQLEAYRNAQNLLVFYPYLGEVNILPLVKSAFSLGKNVYFPKVTDETTMSFMKVNSLEDFTEGYKGIKEPMDGTVFDKENILDKTFMLLPGSVFDLSGNRTGYGKGYYDRYLENCHRNITKAGVCFSLQMLEKIPDVKPTDIPMDYVINEEKIIRREK